MYLEQNQVTIRQSRDWWQSKDLNWFIENAEFAFKNGRLGGYKAARVWIKTKIGYSHDVTSDLFFNCFEFDVEKHGVVIKSETVFSPSIQEDIISKDYNARRMFLSTIEKESKSVVNPSILTEIFNMKDKFIKI